MRDRLSKLLSEIRTLTLGAQILLGFQYQAIFHSGFETLPAYAKALEVIAFALMLAVFACLVAPSSFHRLSEAGNATRRQHAYTQTMLEVALLGFALGIGANVVLVTTVKLGTAGAVLLGAAVFTIAILFWFGVTLMQRTRNRPSRSSLKDEAVPLKERISELLTEARIVLPGAQALLGFQFAAYLTEGFTKLPPASQTVHTISLLLIALAMILLMSPAPYHRIAEGGENTAHFDKVAVRFILAAMVPLAFGLAGDFYIVLEKVLESPPLAATGAVITVVGALLLWFAVPLWWRRPHAETA